MIPVFRRFSISDYPKAPEWLANMFGPLNVFAETTVTTLNKNLTIGQNVQGLKFTTPVTTDGAGLISPVVFQYTGGGQPNCCLIGQIRKSDGTAITAAYAITDWYLNLNSNPFSVVINKIVGLDPSTRYEMTFLVL
jgi:hypothetical protein